jgi:capsular exopolysaccharide synthesis family protein
MEVADGVSRQLIYDSLRRWWKVTLPAGLLLACAANLIVFLLFEPIYRATAWLKIDTSPPYVVLPQAENEQETNRFIATQMQLVKSPMVLTPVISNPAVADLPQVHDELDPVLWLSERLEMERMGDSELFRLSFTSTDAEAATTIVNAITTSYLGFRTQRLDESRNRLVRLLDQEKNKQLEVIKRLRTNLREVAEQSTAGSPFGPLEPAINFGFPLTADLLSRLVTTELAEMDVRTDLDSRKSAPAPARHAPPATDIESQVNSDGQVQQLRAELEGIRGQLKTLEGMSKNPSSSITYRNLLRTEELQRERLAQRETEVRTAARRKATEVTATEAPPDDVAAMRLKVDQLAAQKRHLQTRINQELARLQQGSADNLELEFLKSELSITEDMQELLSTRLTHLLIEAQATDRVHLYQPAEIEKLPVRSLPLKELAMAACGGLLLPFALALAWEHSVKKVSDAGTLERHGSVYLLGEITYIPPIRRSGRLHRARVERQLGMYHNCVDAISTALRVSDHLWQVRSLAVTSAVKGEGKTSFATQLALSIARSTQEPTLLVDGDLRSPAIHLSMDIRLAPGLCEVLQGTATLLEAVSPGVEEHLDILPAGVLTTNPLALLRSEAALEFFSHLNSSYRHIIIDTPPVLSASESLLLAKSADATVVCAMRDLSREEQVVAACRRLELAGAQTIGVVLNGVPIKTYLSKYGAY